MTIHWIAAAIALGILAQPASLQDAGPRTAKPPAVTKPPAPAGPRARDAQPSQQILQTHSKELVTKAFSTADRDANNWLSLREMLTFFQTERREFTVIDKNADGMVSPEEFDRHVQKIVENGGAIYTPIIKNQPAKTASAPAERAQPTSSKPAAAESRVGASFQVGAKKLTNAAHSTGENMTREISRFGTNANENDSYISREDDILLLESRGNGKEAFQKAVALFREIVATAAELKNENDPAARRVSAHGIFLLDTIRRLADWNSLHKEAAAALAVPGTPGFPREFADRILQYSGDCAYITGNLTRVDEVTKSLSYISNWALIGPFDNERGGGFTKKEEPENGWAKDLVARGKERDVRWRKVPVERAPLGILELKELMKPSDQAACYLRTAFRITKREELAFRFSSSEALKVWIDGTNVLEKNVRRELGFDQNVISLELEEGWHEILVKVCTQEMSWRFRCRVTDALGNPIQGVEYDSFRDLKTGKSDSILVKTIPDSAILYFAEKALLRSPDSAPTVVSSKASENATIDAERAAAAHRLSALIQARHAEDITDYSHRESAKFAADYRPNDSVYRMSYALSLKQETNVAEEKELNSFRRELEKAFELDSQNAVAAIHLAHHYSNSNPIPTVSKKWIDRALKISPNNVWAILYLASHYDNANLHREAERALQECAETSIGNNHARILERIGTQTWHRGAVQQAEEIFRKALTVDRMNTNNAGAYLRQILLARGSFDDAVTLLKEESALRPFSVWPHIEMARLYQTRLQKDEMNAAYQRAIELCPDNSEAFAKQAHSFILFDDVENAVRSLEQAVTLDPKDRTSRRYLEFLQSNVKPFEDEFRIDAVEYMKNLPPAVAAADEAIEVLLSQIAYKLNPDGTTQRYEHVIATVLNDEGAKQLDSYRVRYDPSEEQVRIRRARVIRKDGKIDDAPASPGASWVNFPPLAAGDTIDIESRVDTIRVGVFGNYFGMRHLFHGLGLASTRRSEQIYVTALDQNLHFKTRNGAPEPTSAREEDQKRKIYKFSMLGIKKPNIESAMPDAIEFAPSVSVSTYGKWEEFASWWWNLIEKECQSSPAIKDKVVEITKDKKDDLEKIRAIYEFVVTDIRYNAWEFGVHGYKPYNASTIFDRRYGDCKDKAILIKTMLKDVGIDAYPVLIYADESRPIEDLSLPMVGLFNHCIAYVPGNDSRPEMFLDGTATHHPMGVLPDMDHGASVVIVKDGVPVIKDVQYPKAEFNTDATEFHFVLKADGSAAGTATIRPKGNYDVQVRQFFANEKGAQKENLERLLSARLGRVQVSELQTSDLNKLSEPVELRASMEVEKLAKSKGSDFTLPLTTDPRNLLGVASEAERSYDLLLGTPQFDESLITFVIPDSFDVRSIPADGALETPFGSYSIKTTREGNTIKVAAKSSITKSRIVPSEYAAFRQFARSLDEAQAREIVIYQKQ
ncbi:MAG: DUF3857 domain-containing protein [Planctomycetota bacterium]